MSHAPAARKSWEPSPDGEVFDSLINRDQAIASTFGERFVVPTRRREGIRLRQDFRLRFRLPPSFSTSARQVGATRRRDKGSPSPTSRLRLVFSMSHRLFVNVSSLPLFLPVKGWFPLRSSAFALRATARHVASLREKGWCWFTIAETPPGGQGRPPLRRVDE